MVCVGCSAQLRYHANIRPFANENLFEQSLRGETAIELTPHVFIESEYDARWFWKPDDAQGNFTEQEVTVGSNDTWSRGSGRRWGSFR